MQDVLEEAERRLVWCTRELKPWTEGDYEWMWVDNEASNVARRALVSWFSGIYSTRVRGRDSWDLPPGWEGHVDRSVTRRDFPKWIRVGDEYYGYDFELVHIQPLVYRCRRDSGDRWSRPGANDILWLFWKCDQWVAGHADKKKKLVRDVLVEAQRRLVWCTRELAPWTEGDHEWMWVDNEASNVALRALVSWFSGIYSTRELSWA